MNRRLLYILISISYYKNVGSANAPAFRLQTPDFGQLKQLGLTALHPAFGDLTGDGVPDLLCGVENGRVLFFRNLSSAGELPFFANPVSLQNVDVQSFATPQLFDLDNDGRQDLLVGNRRGRIAYYRNVSGGSSPEFQWVTDTLGGVDVRDAEWSFFGHSVPFFFRTQSGEARLLCGNERGTVFCYDHIDGNLAGSFHFVESAFAQETDGGVCPVREGIRSAPVLCDWNDDGYPDLVVGNYAGGLTAYAGIAPLPVGYTYIYRDDIFKLYPNPAANLCHLRPENPGGGSVVMRVMDAKGAVMLARCFAHSPIDDFIFDVSSWKSGIYFVALQSASGCQVKKLVVAH